MSIRLRVEGSTVLLDRAVFTALFDDSVVRTRVPYVRALEASEIKFADFTELAYAADIPYTLFLAPKTTVNAQIALRNKKLLGGVSKNAFSLNSRNDVRLSDVQLIVRDIIRKQETLKRLDKSLKPNTFVGLTKGSRAGVAADAKKIRDAIELPSAGLQDAESKEAALDDLIARLEAKQIFVSQHRAAVAPQQLPRSIKFSGLTVRDRKIPFIFLTGGEGGEAEPAGRKVFTLTLLAVCIARGVFSPVTYNDRTGEMLSQVEYALTEELLMPAAELRGSAVASLDDVKRLADQFKVTPSAFTMRARRLGLVSPAESDELLTELAAEYARREKTQARQPLRVNALRKYLGHEFPTRMFAQLDAKRITQGDFCRIVLLNKLDASRIDDFRRTL